MTVKEIKEFVKNLRHRVEILVNRGWAIDGLVNDYTKSADTIEKLLEEVQQYREIGTIEEFKELKEKNEPKKVDEDYCCPICHTCGMDDDGIKGTYCTDCGQKLDWE